MTDPIVTSNPKKYSSLNFCEAAKEGNLEAIKIWVSQGARILQDELEKALGLAAQAGHLNVVQYLVENGAHPYVRDGGALVNAAAFGHLEVTKYLVERGTDLNALDGAALSWALYSGHLEVAKYLVEQGADLESQLESALSNAVSLGNLEVIKYLIDQGADPTAREGEIIREAAKLARFGFSCLSEILEYLVNHSKVKMFEYTIGKERTLLGEYDRWYNAEKALWTWKKENPKGLAYIIGWNPFNKSFESIDYTPHDFSSCKVSI